MKTETVQIVAPLVLEIPRPPNYLRPAGNDRAQPIDVATLSLAQLETVGKAMTEALIANAHRRRNGGRDGD